MLCISVPGKKVEGDYVVPSLGLSFSSIDEHTLTNIHHNHRYKIDFKYYCVDYVDLSDDRFLLTLVADTKILELILKIEPVPSEERKLLPGWVTPPTPEETLRYGY